MCSISKFAVPAQGGLRKLFDCLIERLFDCDFAQLSRTMTRVSSLSASLLPALTRRYCRKQTWPAVNEGMVISVISREIHLPATAAKDVIRRGLMKESCPQQQVSNSMRVNSNTNVILSALRKSNNGIGVWFQRLFQRLLIFEATKHLQIITHASCHICHPCNKAGKKQQAYKHHSQLIFHARHSITKTPPWAFGSRGRR